MAASSDGGFCQSQPEEIGQYLGTKSGLKRFPSTKVELNDGDVQALSLVVNGHTTVSIFGEALQSVYMMVWWV